LIWPHVCKLLLLLNGHRVLLLLLNGHRVLLLLLNGHRVLLLLLNGHRVLLLLLLNGHSGHTSDGHLVNVLKRYIRSIIYKEK
jgi:hypothetical protein